MFLKCICAGEGVQSYAATVLHAAKSLGKGLRELGETVASSLSGTSSGTSQHITHPGTTDVLQPGIVTILDIQVRALYHKAAIVMFVI